MDGNLTQRIFRPTACVGHEELRQYLSGRMSREGLRRVEDHLLDCPLCSDAVEGCEEAGNHLTDDLEDFEAFSGKLPGQPTTAKVRQLLPGGYLRQAIAVAAMLVVGAVAYFSFDQPTPNGPKLYAKYYDAYENDIPISQRRPGLSDVDPNFAQALTAYTQRQFSHANMLFERAMVNQPDNEAVLFFAAMSCMESNKVAKASKYLQTVSSGKGVYAKKAGWYLILCDLKTGNMEGAKAQLDKLVESGDIMVNEAKSLQEEF